MADDDDAQRKSTAGHIEIASVPGAPNRYLRPGRRPAQPVLRSTPELEATPPQPYARARREREQTRVGLGPPAQPEGQPAASTPLPVPSAGDRSAVPPPSLIPAPWADTTENRVAAVKAGYRTAYVPESPPPLPAYAEPAFWRSASGMVKVIGATAAALVGSTTAIVAIIGALRQPPVPPPAPTTLVDPCPPTVPPLQRSAFCVRFDQLQQAANTAAADAADAKAKAAGAERHADQLEEKIPKIKGLPKP